MDFSKVHIEGECYPPNEVRELHTAVEVVCHYDLDQGHCRVRIDIWRYVMGQFAGEYFAEPSMTFQGQGQGSPYIDTHSYPTPEEALNRCLTAIVGFGNSPRKPILRSSVPYENDKTWNDKTGKWESRF